MCSNIVNFFLLLKLRKLEAIKPEIPKETPETILAGTQAAAKTAADNIAAKYPNSKVWKNSTNAN